MVRDNLRMRWYSRADELSWLMHSTMSPSASCLDLEPAPAKKTESPLGVVGKKLRYMWYYWLWNGVLYCNYPFVLVMPKCLKQENTFSAFLRSIHSWCLGVYGYCLQKEHWVSQTLPLSLNLIPSNRSRPNTFLCKGIRPWFFVIELQQSISLNSWKRVYTCIGSVSVRACATLVQIKWNE